MIYDISNKKKDTMSNCKKEFYCDNCQVYHQLSEDVGYLECNKCKDKTCDFCVPHLECKYDEDTEIYICEFCIKPEPQKKK